MQNAYRSFNNPLITLWASIDSGVPVVIDSPDGADALPASCLRIYWSEYGTPTPQPNMREGLIDIAIRVPPVGNVSNTLLALTRAKALDKALGFEPATDGTPGGGGYGRLGRYDWTTTPITYLSDMEVIPEGGWVAIPTASPGQLHMARTVRLQYRI